MTAPVQTPTGMELPLAERAQARAAAAGEPAWALDARRAAADALATLPFPSRTDELWRRSDFRTLAETLPTLDPFAALAGRAGELPAPIAGRLDPVEAASVVVQRNADVVLERLAPTLQQQGVLLCSLERALREHPALVKPRLGSLLEAHGDRYAALGAALRSGGAFLYVPAGVHAAVPVRLFQWLEAGATLAAPHTLIVLERGAQATVIEEQLSQPSDAVAAHLGSTEVFVAEDARLVYSTLQGWGRNVYHVSNQRAEVRRGGELQWIQILLGGRMTKTNSYFRMVEPGAQVFVHGFMFGDARQHFDMHTLQQHRADHCTSDLLIKACLKDRARSVYQGLIQVAENAQRTDAYQANRNLLLSDTARADSIPGLEILANDVRCTHGATIGTVDEEQMFYLMARGMQRHEAQRLIVEGFFAPVIDRIPLESVREQLREAIESKISKIGTGA